MKQQARGRAGARWREYPIGLGGEMLYAATGTVVAAMVGVGAALGLVLAVGLLGEQGALPAAAASATDITGRIALGLGLALSVAAGLVVTGAHCLKELVTTTTLHRAAQGDADDRAVPPPHQLRYVAQPGYSTLALFGGVTGCIIGILVLLMGIFALVEDYPEMWPVILIGLALTGLLIGLAFLSVRRLRPGHQARAATIADRWSGQEGAAWSRARKVSSDSTGSSTSAPESTSRRLGNSLLLAGGVLIGLALLVMKVTLLTLYPEARRAETDGVNDLGPRAELSDQAESLVAGGLWTLAVMMLVAIVLCFVGNLMLAAAQNAEARRLWAAVKDSTANRPSSDLLQRHSERRPVRLSQVLAAVSGAGGVLAGALWMLASGAAEPMADIYRNSPEQFGPLLPVSTASVAFFALAFLLALAVAGYSHVTTQPLRQALIERWPVRPEAKADSDGNVDPWRKGPVLGRVQAVSRG